MSNELPELDERDLAAIQRTQEIVEKLDEANSDVLVINQTSIELLRDMLDNVNQAVALVVAVQSDED